MPDLIIYTDFYKSPFHVSQIEYVFRLKTQIINVSIKLLTVLCVTLQCDGFRNTYIKDFLSFIFGAFLLYAHPDTHKPSQLWVM